MKYKSEKDMYPDVCQWLETFLKDRFRQAEVDVHSLPHTPISRFLSTYDRGSFPGEWVTWNIKVDVLDLCIIGIGQQIWFSLSAKTRNSRWHPFPNFSGIAVLRDLYTRF